MHLPNTRDEILLSLHHSLKLWSRWGCRGFDCPAETLGVLKRWSQAPETSVRESDKVQGEATLEQVRADLGDCRRCRLGDRRTHLVFGEGDPGADLVFVGEGPGFEEDRSGHPFVGPAGQMLTRIIEAMKLTREQVYICNVIKCRPPDNRNPEPDEIQACRPFLLRQLAVIRPKVICALGTFAARTLLDSTRPISSLRGRFHDLNGIKVMPTYHPSFLLRNPDRKREVWEDMKKIMILLHIPL